MWWAKKLSFFFQFPLVVRIKICRLAMLACFSGVTCNASADALDVWTLRNQPRTGKTLSAIGFGNGRFVTVGYETTAGGTGSYVVAVSFDGINWRVLTAPGLNYQAIAHGNGTFLTVGDYGAILQSDPRVWLTMQSGPSPALLISRPPGNYHIDYSESLTPTGAWLPLTNLALPASPWIWPDAPGAKSRFYRAAWFP